MSTRKLRQAGAGGAGRGGCSSTCAASEARVHAGWPGARPWRSCQRWVLVPRVAAHRLSGMHSFPSAHPTSPRAERSAATTSLPWPPGPPPIPPGLTPTHPAAPGIQPQVVVRAQHSRHALVVHDRQAHAHVHEACGETTGGHRDGFNLVMPCPVQRHPWRFLAGAACHAHAHVRACMAPAPSRAQERSGKSKRCCYRVPHVHAAIDRGAPSGVAPRKRHPGTNPRQQSQPGV